jgi:hypothetical protein
MAMFELLPAERENDPVPRVTAAALRVAAQGQQTDAQSAVRGEPPEVPEGAAQGRAEHG